MSSLRGTFTSLPDIPSPSTLTFGQDATGVDLLVGLRATMPLLGGIRGGLGLSVAGGGLVATAQERVPIVVDGAVYAATIEHRLAPSVTMVDVEPFLRVEALPWLWVDGGIALTTVTGSSYQQTQRFTDPVGLQFSDGATEQVTASGTLPSTAAVIPQVRLRAGAAWTPVAGGAWSVIPGIGYSAMVGPVVAATAWRETSVDVTLGVRYRFGGMTPSVRDTIRDTVVVGDTVTLVERRRDTVVERLDRRTLRAVLQGDTLRVLAEQRYRRRIPLPEEPLDVSFDLSFVHADGSTSDEASVRYRRILRHRSVPMLPLVAFDSGSVDVPVFYRRPDRRRLPAAGQPLVPGAGEHWQALVLVAQAMRARDGEHLVVQGLHDGRTANAMRAGQRAETIAALLRRASGSVNVRAEIAVATEREWTSAVAIVADDAGMVPRTVVVVDTIADADLPTVQIRPDVLGGDIDAYELRVTAPHGVVHVATGHPESQTMPDVLTWRMADDLRADDVIDRPLRVVLTVDAGDRHAVSDTGSVLVRSEGDVVMALTVRDEALTLASQVAGNDPGPVPVTSRLVRGATAEALVLDGLGVRERSLWVGPWNPALGVRHATYEERRP